jgi:hypothetical protein
MAPLRGKIALRWRCQRRFDSFAFHFAAAPARQSCGHLRRPRFSRKSPDVRHSHLFHDSPRSPWTEAFAIGVRNGGFTCHEGKHSARIIFPFGAVWAIAAIGGITLISGIVIVLVMHEQLAASRS